MSKLYIVATPIGNLGDVTLRALDTLKEVDLIACEDTRVTSRLLSKYDIKKELISYHQHSGKFKVDKVVNLLKDGKKVALVSDAGTPGVSDPGSQLLKEIYTNNIEVEIIPGPSALTSALSLCDFNTHEFVFYGFLPHKKGRQTKLREIAKEKKAVILYESVHRIKKLMDQILEFAGDRQVLVARELTKIHETVYRGKVSEVSPQITEKGEFVVIIEGQK